MGTSTTITVDQLSKLLGIQRQTILNYPDELKRQGAFLDEQGELQLPIGTRPHFNKRSLNLDKTGNRYYAILKATRDRCFVDNVSIHVPPEEFPVMLQVLVDTGLLVSTGIENDHGANGFITTLKAETLVKEGARRAVKQLLEIISVAAVAFGQLQ